MSIECFGTGKLKSGKKVSVSNCEFCRVVIQCMLVQLKEGIYLVVKDKVFGKDKGK